MALRPSRALLNRQPTSSRVLQRSSPAPSTSIRSFSSHPLRLAQQDYGSGAGDPKGENPMAQGRNPREDAEHPGPEAPDVGQKSNGSKAAQPKIHSEKAPSGDAEAVRKHNEDLKNTQGTSHGHQGEKVEKGFWKGEGDA
ncbi:MAG: hypothetical protein M1828_001860 [Chrysothrix sp. TS-e1954]|nr:MAG: hypothetical protein M1828_001860 [Chrysothrix sp. TS-e1954]